MIYGTGNRNSTFSIHVDTQAVLNGHPFNPTADRRGWTEGLHPEFDTFIPMGSKEAKSKKDGGEAIFRIYSAGVVTSRDNLVYSFDLALLQERVRTFIEIYNTAVDRRRRHDPKTPIESFIDTTDPRIKWSRQVKASLKK